MLETKIADASWTQVQNRDPVALYNHAIRWEFTDKNPITGPVRGSGVRQSAKRERIPDLLEVEEFQPSSTALPVIVESLERYSEHRRRGFH